MANSFWNFVTRFVPGTLAKAEDVNTQFDGVASGLDSVETEINKAIQIVSSPGTTEISENAAARALKLIQFNSSGDIELGTVIGDYQGDHADAAGTDYYVRDVVKDAAAALGLNNLYICNTAHTSTGDLSADTANWDLLVDVAAVEAAKVAAETAQGLSEDAQGYSEEWAITVENTLVSAAAGGDEVNDYSALHWAAKAAASASSHRDVLLRTLTASASSSIDFTAALGDIDATYDHYYVEVLNAIPSVESDSFYTQVSVSSAFVISSSYWQLTSIDTKFTIVSDCTSSNINPISGRFNLYMAAGGSTRSTYDSRFRHGGGGNAAAGVTENYMSFANNSVIDGLRFYFSTGNIVSGTFKIYGVKK